MNIVTNTLSLAQLFANSNEQFIVPSYQRRYSWKIQHVGALFDDINSLKINDGHLFGMIMLHAGSYNGGFMKPELVDGQQRLTTLTILFKSLEKAYRNIDRPEIANEILKMLQCKGPDRIVKNKLVLGDLDNLDYKIIMSSGDLDKIGNKNLRIAAEDFDRQLKEFKEESLDSFYYKLVNIAVIIRLDVSQAQDAYKNFETINNRGQKLSSTDIIKNFLLGHASKIDNNNTLEQVKSLWSQIIVDLDGISTDNFLRQYLCSVLKRKVTFNGVVDQFKDFYKRNVENAELLGELYTSLSNDYDDEDFSNQTEDEDYNSKEVEIESIARLSIIEFLKLLRTASDVYKKIFNASFSEGWLNVHISNLRRIQCIPSFIFLMHFFQKAYSKKTQKKVLKMIETFMLRRHICERRTGENDYIFSQLMYCIEENTEDEMLYSFRKILLSYYPNDSEFEEKLPAYQFKGKVEDRAKYMLEQFEYDKKGNTKENLINREDVHLEHIIPQTIITNKDWISYLGDKALIKHKKYVSRIGNLTLLAGSLNSQASNNSFLKKKDSYQKSDIYLTNDLNNKMDFKFEEVDERGVELTTKALQIWQIDFSDIEEK